jgi:hypothetical protein
MAIVKPYFSALSFQEIAIAFSSPQTSVGLNKYYRGGQYVENTATNVAIPLAGSGQINSANFYGNIGAVQSIQNLPENTTIYNYDVYANRNAGYIAGSSVITVIVPATTTVASLSPALPALIVPATFTTGDNITIINDGTVTGCGGIGAYVFTNDSDNLEFVGGEGGSPGLSVAFPVTVTNNGLIAGGGGGGGAGGSYRPNKGRWADGTAGGGGAGIIPGAGRPGGDFRTPSSAGTATTGGAAGVAYNFNGTGGAGGNLGQPGGNGSGSTFGGYSGYSAGNAVSGNALITWTVLGTRTGPIA